jgi:homoserine acetyltransferase
MSLLSPSVAALRRLAAVACLAGLSLAAFAQAASYPAPQEGSWFAKDFKFHTGQVMPELRINYLTVGAPTREKADALLDARMKAPFPADANDVLYQWSASGDYNPSGGLERIQAQLLAINAADDERNPPETGIMEREMKRVKNGRLFLIPASDQTAGHGTTGNAKWYRQQLADWLPTVPRRRAEP